MREQRTASHEYSRFAPNRPLFVALCGETAERSGVMIKDAAWWRFSAQVHECARFAPNRPPFVALCGETAERRGVAEFGGGR
jgi:hypothetical protein